MNRRATFRDLEENSNRFSISDVGGVYLDTLDPFLCPTLTDIILAAQDEIHELGILSLMNYDGIYPHFKFVVGKNKPSTTSLTWHHHHGIYIVASSAKDPRLTNTVAVRDRDLYDTLFSIAKKDGYPHNFLSSLATQRPFTPLFSYLKEVLGMQDGMGDKVRSLFEETLTDLRSRELTLEPPWKENEIRIYSDSHWHHARAIPPDISSDQLQNNPPLSVRFLKTMQEVENCCSY